MFFLVSQTIAVVLMLAEIALGIAPESEQSVLATVYELAVLIPTVAVGFRRMHDTDRSGIWLLVPVVSWFLLFADGTDGENRFGPDPKAVPQAA